MTDRHFHNVRSAQERAIFCRRDAYKYAEPLGDKFKARCLREWRKAMAMCHTRLVPLSRRPKWR